MTARSLRRSVVNMLALALAISALSFPVASTRGATAAATITDMPLKGFYDAHSSFYQAGITASDVNGDGRKELLVGNQNGLLYCFNHKSDLVWTFNAGAPIQGTPACFDVDGDGRQEIWVGDMSGRMWGFDCDGKVLSRWGWPKQTKTVGGLAGIFSSPAVGDITGDGAPEIVVGNYGQQVYAWSYKGDLSPGWPYNNEDTIWSSPALADLDWDGLKEVVIGADSTGGVNWPYPPGGLLYAFDGDGTVMDGFPRVTPEVTWSSPACADIDGDGRYEVVVGSGHYYTAIGRLTTQGHRVYAYDRHGNTVKGWPVAVAGCTFSSPALGDVNGDGDREIVIGTTSVGSNGEDTVAVISSAGELLTEIKGYGGPLMGSPALGDIDADGMPDIILGAGQRICAWDHAGNALWKQDMGNFVVCNPAVGDFDADGRVEVAVATGDAPGGAFHGGGFYVFDCGPKPTGAPSGDAAYFPWPMFRLNPEHSATLLTGGEPTPAPKNSWYLAEGSTAGGMETWVLVQNPGSKEAGVFLQYMTPAGPVNGPYATLPAGSRRTFNVADTVPNAWEVSTHVKSDRPVVAERAMYGNGRSWAHESLGASAARKTWYLAEGSTAGGMETWVLVQNPGENTATVSLSFMTSRGPVGGPVFRMPARSRKSFHVADTVKDNYQVSTKVTADRPVVAERSMYGPGRAWAHNSIGASAPSALWYLAEGSTAGGMEDWLLVQNPTYPEANITITYMTRNGAVAGPSVTIPSSSRMTFHVADSVPGCWEVSAKVSSDKPVVAERAMYGNNRAWAHESLGASAPKKTWCLAEGSTGGGMETWVLVQNPNRSPASVSLTYMTPGGPVDGPTARIAGNARMTFFVADTVPDTWEVSTRVTCDRPVVVERAMYGNGRAWAHESVGFGQ